MDVIVSAFFSLRRLTVKTAAPPAPEREHKERDRRAREHKLDLDEVLTWLEADSMVSPRDIEEMRHARGGRISAQHPLIVIAERKWRRASPPHGILHLEALTEWLADHVSLPYLHIDPLKVDFSSVSDVVSSTYAARFSILPVGIDAHEVIIATAEPLLREWEKELEHALQRKVRRVVANPVDVSRYLVEFFNLAKSVKRAAQSGVQGSGLSSFEQLVELGRINQQLDANDQHIVRIVDFLWQYAFDQRASDIHIEPRRDIGFVRFRIDGVLHQVYQIPAVVMAAMTSRIKLLGRMDVIEKRRPQDGRIKTRLPNGDEVELRLSTLPTAFGEKLVMRIFDPEVLVRDFAQLGFSVDDLSRWQAMTTKPNGIILVTGPTGSGKTTTLYSTLKQLATPEVNVCTIEDPIEMVESAFNQMQVQASLETGFAEGVRALMRQDPDIVMIGEIRDLETAEMAIQAALTGHLVLSTLHTNDAATAITRLEDLGVPGYLINATLLGVMAQRLVRTLCPHCKKPAPITEVDREIWRSLLAPWKSQEPTQIFHPVGCLECRMTGFSGRMGIYELLIMSPNLRKLIGKETNIAAVREQAYREGMLALRISGAQKVAAGLTSLEEVARVAPSIDAEST
ncbi:MAG: GspE/PulE family protein [Zoogloeaceae bacterium]|jgi:general secretion pathway protein E|nr:GspE/PulE family protein [Zoogloeaceae bacterium]